MPIPSNIVLRLLPNPPTMGVAPPLIATEPGMRDGTRPVGPNPPVFTLTSTSDSITAAISESNGAESYEIRADNGLPVAGLTLTGLNAEQEYSVQLRGIDQNGAGPWSDPVTRMTAEPYNPVGIILKESFDDQPDWHSELEVNNQGNLPNDGPDYEMHREGYVLPNGVRAVRQVPRFSPARGYPNHHPVIEINDATIAENPNRARGGTGKSFVSWQDCYSPSWNENGGTISDGKYVIVRHRASDVIGETRTTTLTVGGTDYTFSSTPSADPTHSDPPRSTPLPQFQDAVDCEPGAIVESGPILISAGGEATISGPGYGEYNTTYNLDNWPNTLYWNSDGLMFWRLPDGLTEVYVEFWINFSNEMVDDYYTGRLGSNKLFRIMHHDNPDSHTDPNFWEFFQNHNKFHYFWGIKGKPTSIGGYGFENKATVHRHSGRMSLNEHAYPLKRTVYNGAIITTYSPTSGVGTAGYGLNGTTPELTDHENGGVITQGPVHMRQVYGDETVWVKCAHYIKVNSAGGVADGELHNYIDDNRVLCVKGIEWIGVDQVWEDSLPNLVGLGGNDYFHAYLNGEQVERWYAIDDLEIRDSLPEHLRED